MIKRKGFSENVMLVLSGLCVTFLVFFVAISSFGDTPNKSPEQEFLQIYLPHASQHISRVPVGQFGYFEIIFKGSGPDVFLYSNGCRTIGFWIIEHNGPKLGWLINGEDRENWEAIGKQFYRDYLVPKYGKSEKQ